MKLIDKMNAMLTMAYVKMNAFVKDERGDTNFISILVLLGIALALAGVFLSFQEDIMKWVEKNIGTFFTTDVTGRTPKQ